MTGWVFFALLVLILWFHVARWLTRLGFLYLITKGGQQLWEQLNGSGSSTRTTTPSPSDAATQAANTGTPTQGE